MAELAILPSYLIYFVPFAAAGRAGRGGAAAWRVLAGFMLIAMLGLAMRLSLPDFMLEVRLAPCIHIAGVSFAVIASWRVLRRGAERFGAALVLLLVVLHQLGEVEHSLPAVAPSLLAGFFAAELAASKSLLFLERSGPLSVVRHEFENWLNLVANSPERWEKAYRAGQWEFLLGEQQRARHYAIQGIIRDHCGKGASILDVGCGHAILCRQLAGAGFRYTGVDISRTIVERCRAEFSNRKSAEFHVADFERFEAKKDFDVVVFNEVFYYLPLRRLFGAFRKAQSLVRRRRGFIIVSMNNNVKARLAWLILGMEFTASESLSVRNEATGSRWTVKVFGGNRWAD